jgi:hypothetical protein
MKKQLPFRQRRPGNGINLATNTHKQPHPPVHKRENGREWDVMAPATQTRMKINRLETMKSRLMSCAKDTKLRV